METNIINGLEIKRVISNTRELMEQQEEVKRIVISDIPYLKSDTGFYVVGNETLRLLTKLGISSHGKLIYIALVRQAHNNQGGKAIISHGTLAEILGISRATVITHIKPLEEAGLIEMYRRGGIRQGRNYANEYFVNYVYYEKVIE